MKKDGNAGEELTMNYVPVVGITPDGVIQVALNAVQDINAGVVHTEQDAEQDGIHLQLLLQDVHFATTVGIQQEELTRDVLHVLKPLAEHILKLLVHVPLVIRVGMYQEVIAKNAQAGIHSVVPVLLQDVQPATAGIMFQAKAVLRIVLLPVVQRV